MDKLSLERYLEQRGFTPDEAQSVVKRDFRNALSILAQIQAIDKAREVLLVRK